MEKTYRLIYPNTSHPERSVSSQQYMDNLRKLSHEDLLKETERLYGAFHITKGIIEDGERPGQEGQLQNFVKVILGEITSDHQ